MIKAKADLIRKTIEDGTGAVIALNEDVGGVQKGLEIRFGDLTRNEGPVLTLRPGGLKRHRILLRFGGYSAAIVDQIGQANAEQVALARALVRSTDGVSTLSFPAPANFDTWAIDSPAFKLSAERRVRGDRQSDEEIVETCKTLVVPIMAALAELIGYEERVPPEVEEASGELEGVVTVSTVRRRERNPRNRLLCLNLHGYACAACGTDPRTTYGANGMVLEVHHLQPLSQLNEPREYDPRTDLVPLCPTCHRVAHSRRPVPWSPAEVREMMNG